MWLNTGNTLENSKNMLPIYTVKFSQMMVWLLLCSVSLGTEAVWGAVPLALMDSWVHSSQAGLPNTEVSSAKSQIQKLNALSSRSKRCTVPGSQDRSPLPRPQSCDPVARTKTAFTHCVTGSMPLYLLLFLSPRSDSSGNLGSCLWFFTMS